MAGNGHDIGSTGLPLDQYTKKVPPGWRLGLHNYPLRRFTEPLNIWYRLTDHTKAPMGPAVAGRLVGRPFTLANELTLIKVDGAVLRGDAALAHSGEEAVTGTHAGSPTRLQGLITVLREKWDPAAGSGVVRL